MEAATTEQPKPLGASTCQCPVRRVAAVGDLKTHASLQTRVGIATGLVVVGDLIGSGASQEQAIVGETPNLAARLQGVAVPNSVVIAESTRKLVGNLFELEDLRARDLKGIAGPTRAWAALREASVESRPNVGLVRNFKLVFIRNLQQYQRRGTSKHGSPRSLNTIILGAMPGARRPSADVW